MTNLHKSDCEETVRVGSGSRGITPDCRPMFQNVVTLDPQGAQEAWSTLSAFTPAVEFHNLSWRLHLNLIKAIRVSKTLNSMKASQLHEVEDKYSTLQGLRSAGL